MTKKLYDTDLSDQAWAQLIKKEFWGEQKNGNN